MELLYFILCAYGLTQILVYSDLPLLKRIRLPKDSAGGYGKVFHCPMCMGFHVGWFLMLLSPFTELFNFDVTVTNFFLLGWLSSGTSYVLNMVFGDGGIKYTQTMEITHEQPVDFEVDASTGEAL
tara:strand:+ start:498 stop:872 length:375 start_codon:yes stop_codon:yes gene_type:complete